MPFRWESQVYVGGVCVTAYGKELKIPSTVTEIKPYAFYDISLHKLSLPAETTKIDPTAFAFNCNLTDIELDSGNPAYEMSENGVGVIEKSTRTLLMGENAVNADYSGDDIKAVGDYAFSGRPFRNVILPASITKIGKHAFESCGIEKITLPSAVERIEEYAFSCAHYLASVNLPDNATFIGEGAFYSCDKLTSASFAVKDGWERIYTFDNSSSTPDLSSDYNAAQLIKDPFHEMKRTA